jgi:hypothetical protein
MEPKVQQPIVNERHETRINFLKKDKYFQGRRFEELEDRITNTKAILKNLLNSTAQDITENEKNMIFDYFLEEKNYLNNKISEIKLENEKAIKKSNQEKNKINEIIQRETKIESEFSSKFEAVLKESKEKEEAISTLSKKSEKLAKDFRDLAKNRLGSTVKSREIPELLEKKRDAIIRVISKIQDYSKFLETENSSFQSLIQKNYKELIDLKSHAKLSLKIGKSLEELTLPKVTNLVQADIRAKLESPPTDSGSITSRLYKKNNHKIQLKLEEKFIKIESLCNELKTAEVINQTLKEDKNYLLSSSSYINSRKKVKQTTAKVKHVGSFQKTHRRVVSNPLDYFSHPAGNLEPQSSKLDFESDLSRELNNFSIVENQLIEGAGDSIIEDILEIQ